MAETSFRIVLAGGLGAGGIEGETVSAGFVSAGPFIRCRVPRAGLSVAVGGAVGDGIVAGAAEMIGADVATAVGTAPDGKVDVFSVWLARIA
jgi:hypothetical protein